MKISFYSIRFDFYYIVSGTMGQVYVFTVPRERVTPFPPLLLEHLIHGFVDCFPIFHGIVAS